ncbi:Clp protease/crotonase-like domain-containing protein [Rhodopila globiformis]|uniref:Uncharacterized protein n=1 Tax=Rhodopila globiformis TaxID=1071 RepID=A0A2S6NBD9_RHOGL|nr:hypothetical protein [Rhodopila globiformis]PPQ31926.1 hypothetical protein CCS01_16260 [Rhodopila globiformis]
MSITRFVTILALLIAGGSAAWADEYVNTNNGQGAQGVILELNVPGGRTSSVVSETNRIPTSTSYTGATVMTAGTAYPAGHAVGYLVTAPGSVTFTFLDGSTLTLALAASTQFQILPFAVTEYTLSGGAAGTFVNLN